MKYLAVLNFLFVVYALASCSIYSPKSSDPKSGSSAGGLSSDTSQLNGTWSRCVDDSFSQSYQDGPGSHTEALSFDAGDSVTTTLTNYHDAACQKTYSQENADTDIKKYRIAVGDAADQQGAIDTYSEAMNSAVNPTTTKDERVDRTEHFLSPAVPVPGQGNYTSFKIEDGKLLIARVCRAFGEDTPGFGSQYGEGDSHNCATLAGTTPENRSIDFHLVPAYTKK